MDAPNILEARAVTKTYRGRDGTRTDALRGVDLAIPAGETIGLVGESGSGKTTLMRLLLGIEQPTGGSVLFRGADRRELSPARRSELHDSVSAVFQNPYSSLNPRRRLWDVITERRAIERRASRGERRERAAELLRLVGLPEDFADRHPHQLSGGQRQRIAIARALAERPAVVVLDEALSALDVSVSAQIANLLLDLQAELGVAYLFIGHDMDMVRHLCHHVTVLRRGEVVESGPVQEVTERPAAGYTRLLVEASALETLHPDGIRPAGGLTRRA
ncbi:ABC transporter ATP-binding protein [Amycolatopsis acidicola]|uniref:ABC transporter ATP-binding protein n=1 Tax=Amycolatopsis acidicola TaxID=2596893 RepID=UPI001AA04E73|nr:ATP-binding cassette domain-containing protein [Amycolatopsis acidicola]